MSLKTPQPPNSDPSAGKDKDLRRAIARVGAERTVTRVKVAELAFGEHLRTLTADSATRPASHQHALFLAIGSGSPLSSTNSNPSSSHQSGARSPLLKTSCCLTMLHLSQWPRQSKATPNRLRGALMSSE